MPCKRQHASSAPFVEVHHHQHRTRSAVRNAIYVDGDEDAPRRDDGAGCHGGLAVVHDVAPPQVSNTTSTATAAASIVARARHDTFPIVANNSVASDHNATIPQLLANYYSSSSDNEEEDHDEQEREPRINSTTISPTRRRVAEIFANQLVHNCNADLSSSSSSASSVSSSSASLLADENNHDNDRTTTHNDVDINIEEHGFVVQERGNPVQEYEDYPHEDCMDSLFGIGNVNYDNNNANNDEDDGNMNNNNDDNDIVVDPETAFDRAMRLIGVNDGHNNEFQHFNPQFNPDNLYAHPLIAPLKDFGDVRKNQCAFNAFLSCR